VLYNCKDTSLEHRGSEGVKLFHKIHHINANCDGMLAVRTTGSVSFLSTTENEVKLSKALDFPISPLQALFNPIIPEECSILLSDGSFFLCDLESMEQATEIELPGGPKSFFFAAHPRQLYLTRSKTISLFDLRVSAFLI
jgi:hypothetical protein